MTRSLDLVHLCGITFPEKAAKEAVLTVSECVGLDVANLRKACAESHALHDLGIDSLLALELPFVYFEPLGIRFPESWPDFLFDGDGMFSIIKALVLEFADEVDPQSLVIWSRKMDLEYSWR